MDVWDFTCMWICWIFNECEGGWMNLHDITWNHVWDTNMV